MSQNVNTALFEKGAEIFDDLHKYDQARYEIAKDRDDLDTIYEIVQRYCNVIREDSEIV